MDENYPATLPAGKRLIPRTALFWTCVSTFSACASLTLSIDRFRDGKTGHGMMLVLLGLSLGGHGVLYAQRSRFLRGGGQIYLSPEALRVPAGLALFLVALITLLAAVFSIFCIAAFFVIPAQTPVTWLVVSLVNSGLWLCVGYYWQRVLRDRLPSP